MKRVTFSLCLVLLFAVVSCQRNNTPYAGIADTEKDKKEMQPDPARLQ